MRKAEQYYKRNTGRNAFVSTLRSDGYLLMLARLAVSLRRFHRDIALLVFAVEGELSPEVRAALVLCFV